VPFVWDVRDVTWAMASEMADGNRLLGGLPASLLSATMWATARSCDLLVAATPGIARLATEAGASPERIITVENGISEPLRKALTAVRSRNERSRPVVTYVGLLGRAQQLSTLVDVAQRLPDVDFVIVGEGPHRSQIEDQIRRSGCANVRVLGYVPPDRLPDLYGGSDLLFAQVVDSPTLNRTARPSKLLEYMAAGRAMVYAGHGDAVALITEIGCGVGATPGDPEAIAAAMVDLLDDRSRLHDLGRRGAAYVDALPTRHERMQVVADLVRRRFSRSRSIRIALAPKSVS
jgi:glycosyltransferase involved in cell wall biosynthesis